MQSINRTSQLRGQEYAGRIYQQWLGFGDYSYAPPRELADHNYLKTVAPNMATAIRVSVNGKPRPNKIIQFNAWAFRLASAR